MDIFEKFGRATRHAPQVFKGLVAPRATRHRFSKVWSRHAPPAALLFFFMLALPVCAAELQRDSRESLYVVTDYRFIAGEKGGDADLGQSLCGTRCNALSVDRNSFMETGEWSYTRVATGRELTLALDNPFLAGQCICVADEYLVKYDELLGGQRPR